MRVLTTNYVITELSDAKPKSRITKTYEHSVQQQFVNNGIGKMQNTDFEPMHYKDL